MSSNLNTNPAMYVDKITQMSPFNTDSYWEKAFPANESTLAKRVADVAGPTFTFLGIALLGACISAGLAVAFTATTTFSLTSLVVLASIGFVSLAAGQLLCALSGNTEERRKEIAEEKRNLFTYPLDTLRKGMHSQHQDEIIKCLLENSTFNEILAQTTDIFMNGHGKISSQNMKLIKDKIKELASTGKNLTRMALFNLSNFKILSEADIKEVFTQLLKDNSITELSKRLPYKFVKTPLDSICPAFKELVKKKLKENYTVEECAAALKYGLTQSEIDDIAKRIN